MGNENSTSGESAKPPFSGDHLVAAANFFFDWFCRDQKVAPDDVSKLSPGFFIKWIRDYDFEMNRTAVGNLSPRNSADDVPATIAEEIGNKLGIPAAAPEFVMRLGHSSTGLAHMSGIWPYLVLKGRATNHKIRSVQFMLIIQWDDDVIMPMNRMAHADSQPNPIRDAEVVHLLSSEGLQMAYHVLNVSCDQMHDQHLQYKGLASPEVLTKIMLACEDAAKNGNITSDDLAEIAQTVNYMGSLFPRKIPKRVMEEFQQTKSPQPAAKGAAGWNA